MPGTHERTDIMTDTFGDDSWDELTRELGVEKAPAAEPAEEDPALEHDEFAEPAAEGDDFGAGLEPEGDAPDGAEAPSSDDQPGKKRRRRRRRRRKGPGEGEAGEEAPATAEDAPAEAEYSENEYETGPGSESGDLAPVLAGADEDTAGEMLRDLIANWNVPSWDAIIGGLHRPGA
jgi:hypothetical protein